MTPTNPIEDFMPVYKENRETQVYFKDANGEAMVVEVNSPDFDLLNARFVAFKSDKDATEVEVGEVPVSTEPTAPVSEDVNAPENADTQDTAGTIGVDIAAEGTTSETVTTEVDPAEEVKADAPQI